MEELEHRQKVLLRAVIVEYIGTAEPVGSESLVSRYDLGVRSATVRNELAAMSTQGFLEQPHTSSGRIPSDKGYRYFVDRLIISKPVQRENQSALRSVTAEGELLPTLLNETTAALSRLTHLLSAATVVKDRALTIRSALVSALGPHKALVVVVFSNGSAESRVLECPAELTLSQIGEANDSLQRELVGKPLKQVQRYKPTGKAGAPAYEKLMAGIAAIVRALAKEQSRGALVTKGEEYLFGQPEFKHDAERLADILDEIKSSDLLYDALANPDATGTVTIGKEHRSERLHELAVVKKSFMVGEHEAGTIAVIGPTRLSYESNIPLVNYTAQALTEALTKFFG